MRLPTFRGRSGRQSQFGSLLDTFFQDLESDFFGGGFGHLGNTDIYEKDGKLHYETEMPGLKKEDIKIKARDGELIVTGEENSKKKRKVPITCEGGAVMEGSEGLSPYPKK